MLVYLDTAQLAWIEAASPSDRDDFFTVWRASKCQLAVSIQLLQGAVKHGSDADAIRRIGTMVSLQPLRGIPASAAGVLVREAEVQLLEIALGRKTRRAEVRRDLFPPLTPRTLITAVHKHNVDRKSVIEVDVDHDMLKTRDKRGPEASKLDEQHWRLETLKCLDELHRDDYHKVSMFLEAGRKSARDQAGALGLEEAEALRLVDDLRPYDAPGLAVEMAVWRARTAESAPSTSDDQVDEAHVCFAPYVDLMFVDKRTNEYLNREGIRGDGRLSVDATQSIGRARDLTEVLSRISRWADDSNDAD